MKSVMNLTLSCLCWCAVAASASSGQQVPVGSVRTFAPIGFDDNDNSQLVIEGYLDNDCYRLEKPNVRIDTETRQITIQPMASYYQWQCLEVFVPWTQVIDLGKIPAATYSVHVGSSGEAANLVIKESHTVQPDDYVYAAVDSVAVQVDAAQQQISAVLHGRFSNRCSEFDGVNVIDNGKTIDILPIMKSKDTRTCERSNEPFEYKVVLPWKDPGRYLLHIRSLNGQAVNHVFEVPNT